jgi:hypothetical protein
MTLLEIALVSEPGPGKGLASRPALEDKPDGTVIVFTTLRQNCFKRSLLLFFNIIDIRALSHCVSEGHHFDVSVNWRSVHRRYLTR